LRKHFLGTFAAPPRAGFAERLRPVEIPTQFRSILIALAKPEPVISLKFCRGLYAKQRPSFFALAKDGLKMERKLGLPPARRLSAGRLAEDLGLSS
jgi:hypothetical protein